MTMEGDSDLFWAWWVRRTRGFEAPSVMGIVLIRRSAGYVGRCAV